MWKCLLLTYLSALVGTARGACDACLNHQCYSKELLAEKVDGVRPGIYLKENLLYTRFHNYPADTIRRFDLDNGTYKDVKNRWDYIRFAVDQNTGEVYFISDYKAYKLDSNMNFQDSVIDKSVFYMYFKDKLYVTHDAGLYIVENRVSRVIPGTQKRNIVNAIVDKSDDIYFEEVIIEDNYKEYIRRIKKGSTKVTTLATGEYILATDKDSNIIFFNPETNVMYKLDGENDQLVEFGVLTEKTRVVVFDKHNNVIYHNSDNLYLLKPVQTKQCEVKKYENGTRHIVENNVSSPEITNTAAGNHISAETNNRLSKTQGTVEKTFNSSLPNGRNITVKFEVASEDGGKPEGYQNCVCKTTKLSNVTIKIKLN